MAALAVLARTSHADPDVLSLRVHVELDSFAQPFVAVELLGKAEIPVGGFSL
jgi:hypothetical protein